MFLTPVDFGFSILIACDSFSCEFTLTSTPEPTISLTTHHSPLTTHLGERFYVADEILCLLSENAVFHVKNSKSSTQSFVTDFKVELQQEIASYVDTYLPIGAEYDKHFGKRRCKPVFQRLSYSSSASEDSFSNSSTISQRFECVYGSAKLLKYNKINLLII